MTPFALIFKVFSYFRNPSLQKEFDFLQKAEKWFLRESESYQLEQCKSLLEFAGKHSIFWQDHFKNHHFTPSAFNSLENLKKIPPITKTDLLRFNVEIHTNYKFKKRFLSETSGTEGKVIKFWKNEEWDSFNRASMIRGYKWHGVNHWERNGYFWGYNFNKTNIWKIRLIDELQNRFRLFSYDIESIKDFAGKLKKAKYLHGYSSMIYEVAKISNQMGIQFANLKMVKGTSEKIYDSYQDEIQKAFGIKAINEYGAAETGVIGFECPDGNIHVNMQGVIVEEENNEIIVTNLVSKSFPVIRYKLGDYIELIPEVKCKCGLHTPVIKNIIGRIGKTVYGISGIYPSLTFYYIFKNLAINHSIILNYQVVQNEKGKLLFKIEQGLSSPEEKRLVQEIIKYFDNDMTIEILQKQQLHKMDGKLKDFISTIN